MRHRRMANVYIGRNFMRGFLKTDINIEEGKSRGRIEWKNTE